MFFLQYQYQSESPLACSTLLQSFIPTSANTMVIVASRQGHGNSVGKKGLLVKLVFHETFIVLLDFMLILYISYIPSTLITPSVSRSLIQIWKSLASNYLHQVQSQNNLDLDVFEGSQICQSIHGKYFGLYFLTSLVTFSDSPLP